MSRPKRSIPDLYAAAQVGERRALGRLLTLVERGGVAADEISEFAHPDLQNAHVVGITGSPGAGKSTLVGALVEELLAQGRNPAVLAVDPSSPLTGGAILGDRIRIEREGHGFVRSMATRGHSGGLALAVPLAVRLFDAVGFDPVIIETVGVGQVEVDVVGAADTAVVVMTPGMGDAVQANKAGLLEVADVFVVNKADRPGADDVRRDIDLMLDLSHVTGQEDETGYRPPIVMASALHHEGTVDVWSKIAEHVAHLDDQDLRTVRRQRRIRTEIRARVAQQMATAAEVAMDSPQGQALLSAAQTSEISPTTATSQVVAMLRPKESDR